jgi:L-iditol 2-dehydrogenase
VRVPAAAVEQGNVIPLAAHLSTALAALAEPLACVLRGQQAIALGARDSVAILGAGPIGIIHLLLAKSRGARKVIVSDPDRERLERARDFGADRTVNPESEDLASAVRDETSGEGATAVVVATAAAPAFEQALEIAAVGGRVNLFAGLPRDQAVVPLNCNLIHYKELLVTGTTACSTNDCREAIELAGADLLDLASLVSGRFPLAASREAFHAARDRRGLKVLFEPGIGG